ncbi:MAG: hypothetical protein ACREMU_15045 [Gemmatimonadaceae bacterium]
MQRRAARVPKGTTLSVEQERRESMEHERELREHRRWRQFAVLLFVVPAIISLVFSVTTYIVVHAALSQLSGFR